MPAILTLKALMAPLQQHIGRNACAGVALTGKQVAGILDADRDAHEVVREAPLCAQGGRDGGMAHVAGQADEGADAAKADRDLEQLRLLRYCAARLNAVPCNRAHQTQKGRARFGFYCRTHAVLRILNPDHCLQLFEHPMLYIHHYGQVSLKQQAQKEQNACVHRQACIFKPQ